MLLATMKIWCGTNLGCLESVEWDGGIERWNGTLEWNAGIMKLYLAYKDEINVCINVSSL